MKLVDFLSAVLLVTACQIISCHARAPAGYTEHLLLKPLPYTAVLASFTFRSNTSSESFESQHFQHFPRALGQILQHASTKELHLRFSSGRWDDELWGDRPWGGSREGGTGVELWAWVEAKDEQEANARWLTLTNALSGLFCASLNFVDATRTIRPLLAFTPEGQSPVSNSQKLHLLHGSLPNEVVCTENLTPFLKLLPCKGKAGVSSLLDGHKLFDASWQSMAIDVRSFQGLPNEKNRIELEQTIDMVLNIDRAKRLRDDPIPRPVPLENITCDSSRPYAHMTDSCFPVEATTSTDLTLSQVFGKPIASACPFISVENDPESTVCVEFSSSPQQIAVLSSGRYRETRNETISCFSLPDDAEFDVEIGRNTISQQSGNKSFVPIVERTIIGQGQQYGGLHATFKNPSGTMPMRFVYLESLPWFMKPYFHTLRARTIVDHKEVMHLSAEPYKLMYYRPGVDRVRASHVEMILEIAPAGTLEISYEFEKSILRYTEYPPDANRGFDVAPAVIRVLCDSTSDGLAVETTQHIYTRTTSLLLYLPTPDFSMPYNTIILSSTVIALAFGSIYNILVRRFVAAHEGHRSGGLKQMLMTKFASLKLKMISKTKAE